MEWVADRLCWRGQWVDWVAYLLCWRCLVLVLAHWLLAPVHLLLLLLSSDASPFWGAEAAPWLLSAPLLWQLGGPTDPL